MTEFEYEDGLLVRSVTTKESTWTEQDRAEVLALQLYKNAFCPCGCGQKAEDTLSPEESGPAFRVKRQACRARMALIDAQEVADQSNSPYGQARLWSTEKVG